MNRANVQIVNGKIRFASELHEQMFLKKNDRKYAFVVIDDAATGEKRRFFEGALIPAIFYQLPHSGWENFKEAREAIKLEFLPGWTKTTDGERVKYARSTAGLSNAQFGDLIETIIRWMEQQGMEVPDPEAYLAWKDSAPPPGEIYPQLLRWKEQYDEARV